MSQAKFTVSLIGLGLVAGFIVYLAEFGYDVISKLFN
jgi:hypothetical protein